MKLKDIEKGSKASKILNKFPTSFNAQKKRR